MADIDLRHIARLARLRFTDAELKVFEAQVAGILNFVDQLKAVDITNVEPTSHPLFIKNVFREDAVTHPPADRPHFFEVPKIIEGK